MRLDEFISEIDRQKRTGKTFTGTGIKWSIDHLIFGLIGSGLVAVALVCVFYGGVYIAPSSANQVERSSDVDKIIEAKAIVRSMANYPDTVEFHTMSTKVDGDRVTLKFTAKNAFGVPDTRIMTIDVGK